MTASLALAAGAQAADSVTYQADAARVFAVTYDGRVSARAADTGAEQWSVKLDQYSFSSPPTAVDGTVYVGGAGSGGTLYALDEGTGAVRWSRPVANGDNSSPA